MLTVQNIYNSFAELKRDVADIPGSAFIEWVKFAVEFVYDKTKGIDPERYVKEQLYTITTTPYTSVLPLDLMDLNQTSCGLYLMNGTTPTTAKLGFTGYGCTGDGYYLTGSNIVFTGANLDGKKFTMRYMPVPPTLTSLGDFITVDGTSLTPAIVEDRHLNYLVKAVDVLYEQWDANAGAESTADFRFVRALGGILDGFKRTPQISQTADYTQDF